LSTEEVDSCINFNKNSWHYRLVIFIFGRYWIYDYNNNGKFDTSLCTYMRHVVGAMFIFPFKGFWQILPDRLTDHRDLMIVIIAWAFASGAIHGVFQYELKLFTEYWWFGFGLFFGGIALTLIVIGFIYLIIKLGDRYDNWLKAKLDKYHKKERKIKKPSLALEYLKAKKSKICPCIKFVDEETRNDHHG